MLHSHRSLYPILVTPSVCSMASQYIVRLDFALCGSSAGRTLPVAQVSCAYAVEKNKDYAGPARKHTGHPFALMTIS